VYYLTFWYKPEERSLRVALILASATLAGAFGGAIAYGVGHMNEVRGLSAWRWLFILEGIPSCASAILIYFFFPDYPSTARWLTQDEKDYAEQRLVTPSSVNASALVTKKDIITTLTTWRLYVHYAIYICISCPFSSLSLFSPTIVSGLGYTSLTANLMTVPPYAAAYVVTVLVAYSADRTNTRGLHTAGASTVGAIGFLASAVLPAESYGARYACLIIGSCGSFACIPPLLGWLSTNVRSTAAAGVAIAMNISFGAPGQIIGLYIYKTDEAKKGYPTGHAVNSALLFVTAIGSVLLSFWYRKQNANALARGEIPIFAT